MEQQLPMAFQVSFYAVSVAIIVLAAVLVHVLLRLKKQVDRVVTVVESLEAELTPLARETRLVVDRLRDLSEGAQRVVGLAGGLLLPPVLAFNRTTQLLRAGATTFLQALWNGRRQAEKDSAS